MAKYLTVIAHSNELCNDALKNLIAKFGEKYIVLSEKRAFRWEVTDSTVAPELEGADVIISPELKPGLVVFDMDSTLIYQEVIELIAAYAGVEDQVEAITTLAMNGEIDFTESLNRRVALLKGIPTATLYDEIKQKLVVTKGVPELCAGLKKMDCKLAVLSGGFIPLASFIKEKLSLDYAFANTLGTATENGVEILDGTTRGAIVDGAKKAELLQQIAQDNGIAIENTIMVGDGSNDLPAMGVAGWGVAWNAKPKVQKLAPCKLNTKSMSDMFYILGLSDEQISQL